MYGENHPQQDINLTTQRTRRGWCAGRNPSSVLGSIQLSGPPASHADLTDAYLPLHPAGQPFHRFHHHPQRLNTYHRQLMMDVPFLLSSQDSRPTPHGVAALHGGWSFLRPQRPESYPPAHQPQNLTVMWSNKKISKTLGYNASILELRLTKSD